MGRHRFRCLAATVLLLAGCSTSSQSETSPDEVATTTAAPATTVSSTITTTTTAPPATTQVDGPDWIFHNGTVVTITNGRYEALAVDGERIAALGDDDEMLAMAASSTRIIDLDGRALLPGFIDAHSHAFQNDGAAAQELMLAGGVTTVTEMSTNPDTLQLLYDLDADDDLRVRVSAYLVHTDACGGIQDEWWREPLDTAAERVSGDMLQLAGVKIFTDGGVCNGIARSFPVAAGLENGPKYFDDQVITDIVAGLDAEGYTAGIHALGDLAVRQVLDVYQTVIGGTDNELRHRLEHNALVHPDDRDRYDDAGMVAVIFGQFPACAFQEGLATGVGTPAAYMDFEWPYAELTRSNPNTVFAWHVDYPYFFDWNVPDHLHGFVTRVERAADGTWCYPPEATAEGLDVAEALEIMTMGSAYAINREHEIGSLEAGKYADLTILSADPGVVDPFDLADVTVDFTMVAGVAEFCGPAFADQC
jgi:predicted amidohydrolase YtcJ